LIYQFINCVKTKNLLFSCIYLYGRNWFQSNRNINCLVGIFQVATLNGHHQKRSILTNNVPVVHMEWDVMILILIFHYKSHWKGWSLKIETFLGPERAEQAVRTTYHSTNHTAGPHSSSWTGHRVDPALYGLRPPWSPRPGEGGECAPFH
jgi:hypothetical protein